MRIVRVLGIAPSGLFVTGAVTACGQINTRAQYGETTAAIIDTREICTCLPTIGPLTRRWAVARDDGPGSKQLHGVYASPGTFAAYRKDGHFPDGTILVKEVFNTTTKRDDNRNRKQCRHPRWRWIVEKRRFSLEHIQQRDK